MIWNLIGTIGRKVLDIVDNVVEDKDAANKLKLQVQKQLLESNSTELEAQAKIVLAEAQGSWLRILSLTSVRKSFQTKCYS